MSWNILDKVLYPLINKISDIIRRKLPMPFIHVRSLPMTTSLSVPDIIKGIALDFSDKIGVGLHHIHTTWEFYQPGHYARGNRVADVQPETNFPIIVDMIAPDNNPKGTITLMLETVAESISKRANFPKDNVFINYRQVHSGMVFDDGEIVHF